MMKSKIYYSFGLAISVSLFLPLNLKAQFIKEKSNKVGSSNNISSKPLPDASRIGRTSGSKAPEFQELYDYEVSSKNLVGATFPYQTLLHKAYVIMLAEQKIISHQEAKIILNGLLKTDKLAIENPSLQVYLPYEAQLIKEIGSVGGKMHIGRSRNDLDNTINRMFLRDQLLGVIGAVIQLRTAIQAKAIDHLQTVMVIYTHRKEAQPGTLAHYLTAIDESLAKSLDRYLQLYERMDQSPLGSGASGGTSWNLDRYRVAGLLGFDQLVVNTIEGAAGWDHIAEFASDNAIFMSDLSRLASELQLWSTDEYNSVELDNSYAGISSMMPQKKNPDALERTRKAAAITTGQLMSILTSLNGIEYQHSGVRIMIEPKAIDALLAAAHTMTGLVSTLHVNKETMLRYATENFSTMTDLADLLVRNANLDFRDAHEIIASVVNRAIAEKKTANQITIAMIQDIAEKRLGHQLSISKKQLQTVLDPVQSVAHKTGPGMPAIASVMQMITNGQKDVTAKTSWLEKQNTHLDIKNHELMELVKAYCL
ncbi:argininosuccinate lyase [Pedobacter cryoconitis]|uniref:Argininosuccinate lyase n=1 Tax=Pedobacter cryoconitis TaxID=188932 RepID=A0A7W8ZII7_9SPHI|nr:argininosuccinate lyase [Pedobacter cryoconitis]MBB5634408.1 argininosuccinate lyase [Pedobacter cryoconitis]